MSVLSDDDWFLQTFRDRFRQLMDWAQNMAADQQVTERLDHLEKQVLANGRVAQMKQNSWLANGVSRIVAAEMVVNLKKRKLSALDLKWNVWKLQLLWWPYLHR